MVTKVNPKEVALGKAQGAVTKYLITIPPDLSWKNVKAVLHHQFSLVPTVNHVAIHLMHKYQKEGESLQESNFEFSKHIQPVINHEPKDITDPLKIYMYTPKLFNHSVSAKTIRHAHLTLQRPIDYAQKIYREFFLVEGIQQSKFDTVMSIDISTCNHPLRQQRLANITCYKCRQKGHYRKDCLNSAGTSHSPDQNISVQPYSPSTTVTQKVTVPYAASQSHLVTILKELAKTKQTNRHLKNNIQMPQPKPVVPPEVVELTKPATTLKMAPIETNLMCKKKMHFHAKPPAKFTINTSN